jgi:glutamate dehydrogenase (NAD(P)+)
MDKYGPEKVLQAFNPITGGLGLLVIDNTALGPSLGGLYVSRNVTVEDASEFARRHSLMNALHELPYGGGCGIVLMGEDRRADVRGFAASVAPLAGSSFIAYPTGNLCESDMEDYAYSCGDVRSAAGKPSSLKGIPFEAGGVGMGIAHCSLAALQVMRLNAPTASVFGLGRDSLFAIKMLARNGIKVLAATDGEGATVNKEGLDIESMAKMISSGGAVNAFPRGEPSTIENALLAPVDIMLLAGGGKISQNLANDLNAKIIVECEMGALNGEISKMLEGRGSTVLPDILALGGAPTCAHVERMGGSVVDMAEIVANSMRRITLKALESQGNIRKACELLSLTRIEEASERKKGEIKEVGRDY